MSLYCSVKTQFKNQDALVAALMETGKWQVNQIDVYDVAQNLFGYKGDQRKEVAHIIIRRESVGRSANDMGFVRNPDGTYSAIISEYDKRKYNDAWLKQLRGNYAYHAIRLQQAARGRSVSRERMSDGSQRVRVKGYR